MDDTDVINAARKYGMPDATCFQEMYLEGDGTIAGVLKPEYRQGHLQAATKAA